MSGKSEDVQALEARIKELEAELAQRQVRPADAPRPDETPNDELTDLVLQTNRTASFAWHSETDDSVFSRNCLKSLGYTDPEYTNTGETARAFIERHMTPESLTRNHEAIRRCIITAAPQCEQLQLRNQAGELIWFELRVQATHKHDDGRTRCIVGTLTQIHELKKRHLINEEHANTERWLRMLLRGLLEDDSDEVMYQTLAYIGDHMQLDYCALRSVDTDTHETHRSYLWQRDNNLVGPNQIESVSLQKLPMLKQALSSGNPVLVNNDNIKTLLDPILVKRLRSNRDISAALIPLHFQGKLDAVLSLVSLNRLHPLQESNLEEAHIIGDAMARAITRQRLHKQLTLRDERYAYALEASRDGLWDWNLDTQELHFSKSYMRMLGYEPGELPHDFDTFSNILVYPDDAAFVFNVSNEAYKSRDGVISCEFRMQHKSGKIVWIYSRAKFVDHDEDGLPHRCVGTNADITRFKDTQSELRQAKVEAIAANQTKNEFLTRMSHEIRTPMNAIIGMGHLLKDTSLNSKQHNFLESINDSAESLLHIIDEILDFSKLESGKFLLENNHFDLDDVYEKLSQSLRIKAEEKNIELIFDISHNMPRFIKGDYRRLYQVLHNLLDNAVKFTPQGEITMRCRMLKQKKKQVRIEFSVTDSGIGINSKDLGNLFDPFTQADGSTSRRFGGTGLGLTICRYLVEQMHGDINVTSNEGAGSCFTFSALFDQSQLGDKPMHHQPQRYHGLRTLIVDDHPSALTVLEKTATALKLNVTTASCAEDALTLLCEHNGQGDEFFELVLMDFKMPRINGIEACQMIRQHPSLTHQPKNILISSYSRDEIEEQTHIDHIDGFIRKPVTPSRIFDAVAVTFGEALFEEDEQDQPHSLSADEQDQQLQGARVLLAEDNLINQKVAIGMLKKKGVEVIVANNGLEAVERLQREPSGYFGAILMDMEMPEMDGYQATREIRKGEHEPDITIIAMTAHALQGDRERCIETGMDDYITKPVNPQLLYSTLAHYLAHPSHS